MQRSPASLKPCARALQPTGYFEETRWARLMLEHETSNKSYLYADDLRLKKQMSYLSMVANYPKHY